MKVKKITLNENILIEGKEIGLKIKSYINCLNKKQKAHPANIKIIIDFTYIDDILNAINTIIKIERYYISRKERIAYLYFRIPNSYYIKLLYITENIIAGNLSIKFDYEKGFADEDKRIAKELYDYFKEWKENKSSITTQIFKNKYF